MTVQLPPTTGPYNAATDLIERNLSAHSQRIAFVEASDTYTFSDVATRAGSAGAALGALGLEPGDRVLLCALDGIDFITAFLGAIKAGLVPIPVSTLLPADDYAHILVDSEARAILVASPVISQIETAMLRAGWRGELIVCGGGNPQFARSFTDLIEKTPHDTPPYKSNAEDIAFWLYSSGSTGPPKGTPHRHCSLAITAELFGRNILGLHGQDVIYSAAKLSFAYGLGNSLTFPMAVGATAILYPGRVTPEIVAEIVQKHNVTVFCGTPTLFRAVLAGPNLPTRMSSLRLCISAGEALPESIGRRWLELTGVDIIEGFGSTEMLHVFISNRPGVVRYGTTGYPVPGYEVQLLDENGRKVGAGAMGELYVRGPTMTPAYWNQPEKSAHTFAGGWMRTGDDFIMHGDGALTHCGRVDDMLKVSGMWVSPSEVENALIAHEAVLEAAVVGVLDEAGLTKTKAFVVVAPGVDADEPLRQALKNFVKARLAPHKYPRSIEFVTQLPKTATGKIRRYIFRESKHYGSAD